MKYVWSDRTATVVLIAGFIVCSLVFGFMFGYYGYLTDDLSNPYALFWIFSQIIVGLMAVMLFVMGRGLENATKLVNGYLHNCGCVNPKLLMYSLNGGALVAIRDTTGAWHDVDVTTIVTEFDNRIKIYHFSFASGDVCVVVSGFVSIFTRVA